MGDPAYPPPPSATEPQPQPGPDQPPPPSVPPQAEPLPGQVPPPYPGPPNPSVQPQPGPYPPAYPVQSQPLQPGYGAQPGAHPAHAMQSTTVVVTQQPVPTVAIATIRFGDNPVLMPCTACHSQITTCVVREKGTMVWLMVLIICLLGFWAGCCLIPLCIPSCHDVIHSCPVCKTRLGVCKRL